MAFWVKAGKAPDGVGCAWCAHHAEQPRRRTLGKAKTGEDGP
jgi:hypothetical protein